MDRHCGRAQLPAVRRHPRRDMGAACYAAARAGADGAGKTLSRIPRPDRQVANDRASALESQRVDGLLSGFGSDSMASRTPNQFFGKGTGSAFRRKTDRPCGHDRRRQYQRPLALGSDRVFPGTRPRVERYGQRRRAATSQSTEVQVQNGRRATAPAEARAPRGFRTSEATGSAPSSRPPAPAARTPRPSPCLSPARPVHGTRG